MGNHVGKTWCITTQKTNLVIGFFETQYQHADCFHFVLEFYIIMEVSNKDVDSSTNCDLTTEFGLHLIGIQLNPKSHLYIMLVSWQPRLVSCDRLLLFLRFLLLSDSIQESSVKIRM